MITQSEVQSLHEAYCKLTGLCVPLTMQRIYAWELWSVQGFTQADLVLVIRHLKSLISQKRKTIGCLRFGGLIQNTEWFAEDLAEARALNRAPRVDPERRAVLKATGRPSDVEPGISMSAHEIMEQHDLMASMLKAFRATL